MKFQATGDENNIVKTQREEIGHIQSLRHQSISGFSAEAPSQKAAELGCVGIPRHGPTVHGGRGPPA